MKEKAQELIEGMISVWIRNAYSKPLAEILKGETENIIPEIVNILGQKRRTKYDEARSFIINYVSGKYKIKLRTEHFVKDDGKDKETIEIIIEDPFYERLVSEYQNELSGIILPCIQNNEHFTDFLKFFMEGLEEDIAKRFKAMLWFASLLTELVRTDIKNVSTRP